MVWKWSIQTHLSLIGPPTDNCNKSQMRTATFLCETHTHRERFMALEAGLSFPLHTPLLRNVAGRKFLSRRVTWRSTIEFVISDPAGAKHLLLSVSSSLVDILCFLGCLFYFFTHQELHSIKISRINKCREEACATYGNCSGMPLVSLQKHKENTVKRHIIMSKTMTPLGAGTEQKKNDWIERYSVEGKRGACRCATSIYFLIPKTGEAAQTLSLRKEPFWGIGKTYTRCWVVW